MRTHRMPLGQGLVILSLALTTAIVFSAGVGSSEIALADCFRIVMSKIPLVGQGINLENIPSQAVTIVTQVRLPRILLAAMVGMGLAASGVVYQGIFKNPMADPFVLGVSSGAAVGATLVIVSGFAFMIGPISSISIGAFAGSVLAAGFVFNLARVGNRTPVVTLLLSGIAVNFFLSSIISLIMSLSHDQVERIVYWTMGSVSSASWDKVAITVLPLIVGLALMLAHTRELNAFALGEDNARSLGIDTERVRIRLLIISSLLTASAVSVSGIIGFVGLVIPHVVRMISGPNHKSLMPFSIFVGAIFLVVSDTIARVIVAPSELPLGVITALFGAPYFLYLLYKSKLTVKEG